MSRYKIILTAGLAMFAMFFGSGNLVFPLIIGTKSTDQYILASIGLLLTGVLVPFLGLFSMILYNGNKEKYFGILGKSAPFILSFLILALIGPFGVVPRCILVAYGGLNVIMPDLELWLFSAIFVGLIFWIIFKKSEVVPIIGKVLGPLKIAGIFVIIIAAIYQSPNLIALPSDDHPFVLGAAQGYQMMDLMAAFFFSITIVEYLQGVSKGREDTINLSIKASIIGALLIATVYFGFISLGAHYAPQLSEVRPEQYLATIAHLTLGKYATLIVAFTIFLSCLATGASLVKLFAEFLQKDIAKEKISWNSAVIFTLLVSFALSLTGFETIFGFLATILTYIYPALITLTITSIWSKYRNFKWSKHCFWFTFVGIAIINLL